MNDWNVFDSFPQDHGHTCPVCGTKEDKPCVLIAIQGTEDGNNVEATPVHSDCLNPELFWYNRKLGIIYARAENG